MIKKLLSLFAIATLASFATYANEEVTNAPVILEEVNEIVKGDLLAADEVLLEDAIVADEPKTELADCGCGCGPKKKGNEDDCKDEKLLAKCKSCGKKKKSNETTAEPVEAPKELLASCCPATTEATDEILPTDEAVEKFASCPNCPATTTEATDEILPTDEAVEKFASCCPATTTEAADEILPTDEAVEKFASCCPSEATEAADEILVADEAVEKLA